MPLPALALSLQFAPQFAAPSDAATPAPDGGALPEAAAHRTALARHRVRRWLRHALDAEGEITVRIVGEDEGRELNHTYRHRDYATNVLTFDYSQQPVVCADLVLCAPVVAREAAAQGKTLEAHYAHLIVHGCLHAQGWDHETNEADAQAMEARERLILHRLGYPDPYQDAAPSNGPVTSAHSNTA